MVYNDELMIVTTKGGYLIKSKISGVVAFGVTVTEAKEKLYRKLLREGKEITYA